MKESQPRSAPMVRGRLMPALESVIDHLRAFAPVLLVLYLLGLTYILLRPFEFSAPSSRPFFSFIIAADGQITLSKNWTKRDLLNNVLLFMPFGALIFASVQRCVRSSALAILIGALGAGAASAVFETLQFFLPSRESAITDLITNGTGAVLGAAGCWLGFLVTLRWGAPTSGAAAAPGGGAGTATQRRPSVTSPAAVEIGVGAAAHPPGSKSGASARMSGRGRSRAE